MKEKKNKRFINNYRNKKKDRSIIIIIKIIITTRVEILIKNSEVRIQNSLSC